MENIYKVWVIGRGANLQIFCVKEMTGKPLCMLVINQEKAIGGDF